MTVVRTSRRRRALAIGRGCIAGGVALVGATLWTMVPRLSPAYGVATDGGPAVVVSVLTPDGTPTAGPALTSGTSKTAFGLQLPGDAACSGDSANSNPPYLVQSYMVPSSVQVATLVFDADGPTPAGTGASFRQPLYKLSSSPFVNELTAPGVPAGGPGAVINTNATPFNLAVYAPAEAPPAGTYNVGIACTRNEPSNIQLDKFWNVQMIIATVAATTDNPAGVTWTVAAANTSTSTSTSTSSSTSTTLSTSTSTSTSSSTSSTSTTVDSSTSTTATTTADSTTTTAPTGGSVGEGSTGTTSGGIQTAQLTRTGGTPWAFIAASALLMIFGRMAVLFARRPEVQAGARD